MAWLEEVQGNNKLTVFDVKSAGLSSYPVPGTMADLAWSPDSAKLAWVDEISLGEVEKLVVLISILPNAPSFISPKTLPVSYGLTARPWRWPIAALPRTGG